MDILSALSTTGAVFLSLWVLRRKNKAKINILSKGDSLK